MRNRGCLRVVSSTSRLKLVRSVPRITADAGLLAYRELEEAKGLLTWPRVVFRRIAVPARTLARHDGCSCAKVFGRLGGYDDLCDADRLGTNIPPCAGLSHGRKAIARQAASTSPEILDASRELLMIHRRNVDPAWSYLGERRCDRIDKCLFMTAIRRRSSIRATWTAASAGWPMAEQDYSEQRTMVTSAGTCYGFHPLFGWYMGNVGLKAEVVCTNLRCRLCGVVSTGGRGATL